VKTSLCVCLSALVASTIAHGQSTDAVDRSQLFRTNPGITAPGQNVDESGTSQGYAAPTANDQDLGIQAILKRQAEYKPFSVSLALPFYFTSNVALSPTHERSDVIFTPSIAVFYQPHIAQTFYVNAGIADQLFTYDEYGTLNFSSFDATIGAGYYLPQLHDLALGLHYDYNELINDHGDRLFSNHQLLFTAEMPFRLGRAMQISTGIAVNISLAAEPETPRRDEYEFHVAYDVQLSRAFTIDAVARVAVKQFEINRTDVTEMIALTANYRVRDWLSLTAISTFAWNQSSDSAFNYDVVNLGGAVGVTVRF